jgi:hypothetical protein
MNMADRGATSNYHRAGALVVATWAGLFTAWWLAQEAHSIYGDEGWHFLFLFDALDKAKQGGWRGIVALLSFNDAYPPAFYLLSSPFVLARDPVAGGRFFVAMLSVLAAVLAYLWLRRRFGVAASATAAMALFVCPEFVEATRHYMLEIALAAETLLMALVAWPSCLGRERGRWSGPLVGLVLALGLLTKFNFALYAAPLVVLKLWADWRAAGRSFDARWIKDCARIALTPLIVAGPWYVHTLVRPGGALSNWRTMQRAGHLPVVASWNVQFEASIFTLQRVAPPWLVVCLIVALAPAVVFATWRGDVRARLRTRLPLVIFGLGYFVFLFLVLARLGLHWVPRWNLGYLFLLPWVAVAVDWPASRACRLVLGIVLGSLVVVSGAQSFLGFRPLIGGLEPWTSARIVGPPSRTANGMGEAAAAMTRIDAAHPTMGRTVSPLFLFHNDAHVGALAFYLRMQGSRLSPLGVGYYNLPVDLSLVTTAPFLLVHRLDADADPEMRRYRFVAKQWITAPSSPFTREATFVTRHGEIELWRRTRASTLEDVRRLIQAARPIDAGTPYEAFWDAESLRLDPERLATPEGQRTRDRLTADLPHLATRLNPAVFARLRQMVADLQRLPAEEPAPPFAAGASARYDTGNGALDVARFKGGIGAGCYVLSGWAGDTSKGNPPREVIVTGADSRVLDRILSFYDRGDVEAYYGKSGLRRSGFEVCIPQRRFLASDTSQVRLFVATRDGSVIEFARARP